MVRLFYFIIINNTPKINCTLFFRDHGLISRICFINHFIQFLRSFIICTDIFLQQLHLSSQITISKIVVEHIYEGIVLTLAKLFLQKVN